MANQLQSQQCGQRWHLQVETSFGICNICWITGINSNVVIPANAIWDVEVLLYICSLLWVLACRQVYTLMLSLRLNIVIYWMYRYIYIYTYICGTTIMGWWESHLKIFFYFINQRTINIKFIGSGKWSQGKSSSI